MYYCATIEQDMKHFYNFLNGFCCCLCGINPDSVGPYLFRYRIVRVFGIHKRSSQTHMNGSLLGVLVIWGGIPTRVFLIRNHSFIPLGQPSKYTLT